MQSKGILFFFYVVSFTTVIYPFSVFEFYFLLCHNYFVVVCYDLFYLLLLYTERVRIDCLSLTDTEYNNEDGKGGLSYFY